MNLSTVDSYINPGDNIFDEAHNQFEARVPNTRRLVYHKHNITMTTCNRPERLNRTFLQ